MFGMAGFSQNFMVISGFPEGHWGDTIFGMNGNTFTISDDIVLGLCNIRNSKGVTSQFFRCSAFKWA